MWVLVSFNGYVTPYNYHAMDSLIICGLVWFNGYVIVYKYDITGSFPDTCI